MTTYYKVSIFFCLIFGFNSQLVASDTFSFARRASVYSVPPGDTPNHKTGEIEPGVVSCNEIILGDQVTIKQGKKFSKFSGYVFVKILSGGCKEKKGYVAKWALKRNI